MFTDRIDAAQQLSKKLAAYRGCHGLVMAVPRGGVPIGAVVARELQLPLDIVLAKKIGHPMNKEYAIASVTPDGLVYNRQLSDVDPAYLREEGNRIIAELQRRYALYTGGAASAAVEGRIVLLVDDGIATGSTLIAAIRGLRLRKPAKIVLAVPVAPPAAAALFRDLADEYICLLEPAAFGGVGEFYEDFGEVSDEEVKAILHAAT
ncbi:MAG: phosphoribosyltransferase [Bacteroidia bacterium]|nr:phosphoribosyltransferase [Bacteroidia bacterium]